MQVLIPEQDMAMRNEDRQWVRREINVAISDTIESFRPRRLKRIFSWLKEFSLVGTVIMVFLALVGITIGSLYQSFAHIKEETEFRAETKGALENVRKQLAVLRGLTAANQPTKPQNQQAAKELLAEARTGMVPDLPESVVEQVGRSFIEATEEAPKAWEVALDFLSYRSSLNEKAKPGTPVLPIPVTERTRYMPAAIKGKPVPDMYHSWEISVPVEESARLEDIGQDLNRGVRRGPLWLFLVGGSTVLDGKHIRGVVFEGVEVHYFGGPLILQRGIFINCRFVIHNVPQGRQFGERILALAEVSFQT